MPVKKQVQSIPPGWVGGFSTSDKAFSYPDPNLTSLPLLGNMDNINLLQRQQGIKWPEFSWETQKDAVDTKRCFQMFSPYISRLGYTDEGRIYSVICPQQGVWFPKLGITMNVEVTVTGQRGWVDEPSKELAADLTVTGKIWFTTSGHDTWFVQMLWSIFKYSGAPFPFDKANAIEVTTHDASDPGQAFFPIRFGESPLFKAPPFARHEDKAWAVANIGVAIGPITPTHIGIVDEFNQLVMDLFNLSSGNMLQNGNLLTWNVWFVEPALVNQEEWRMHAERWRKSIDVEHRSPTGPGTNARFFNGDEFYPVEALLEEKFKELMDWIWKHLP
jgi:hypothetical protein